MIHWWYYKSGDLFLVKYYFEHAGDTLPVHAHEKEEAHNVMVVEGLVEVRAGDVTFVGAPSAMIDFDWSLPHTVEARHARTTTLHGYLYGRPHWYDGLPISGTLPGNAAEAAALSASPEGQGPSSRAGSDERHIR